MWHQLRGQELEGDPGVLQLDGGQQSVEGEWSPDASLEPRIDLGAYDFVPQSLGPGHPEEGRGRLPRSSLQRN